MNIYQCVFSTCKSVVCIIVSGMNFVAYFDQSIVPTQDVGANQTFQLTFPVNNVLQDGFILILGYLGVEFTVSLGLAEKGCFLK